MDSDRFLFAQLNHGNVEALKELDARSFVKDQATKQSSMAEFGSNGLSEISNSRQSAWTTSDSVKSKYRRDTSSTLVNETDLEDDASTISSSGSISSTTIAESYDLSPDTLVKGSSPSYPQDGQLPWNTSLIDEWVGGMSAPTERCNWNALQRLNVGLVVNLTESCIQPNISRGPRVCTGCRLVQETYAPDLWQDLERPISILHLPILDGSVPAWHQTLVFLHHVHKTIAQGKRVMVHCQAGIGRTGTYLAIYLMDRYNLTAPEAVSRLRQVRPQSMRFRRGDYITEPFKEVPDIEYEINHLQHGYVERWSRMFGPCFDDETNLVPPHLRPIVKDLLDSRVGGKSGKESAVIKEATELAKKEIARKVKIIPTSSCAICMRMPVIGPIEAIRI